MAKSRTRRAHAQKIDVPMAASKPNVADVLHAYRWTTLEAKNLLLCISIADNYCGSVGDDLRPAIGVAIDGVARMLAAVDRQFGDDMEVAHG